MFECNIDHLLDAYSSQYCRTQKSKLLVLGTFAYKQEVMHAILVCPPDATEWIAALPDVHDPTSRGVITQSTEGIWEWKPESTGYKANYFNRCKIIQYWKMGACHFRISYIG